MCSECCRLNREIDINVFFGAAGVMRNDRDIIPVCNLSKHWQRWCGEGHRGWQGWALSSSPCLNGIYVGLAPMRKIQFATLCRWLKSNYKMTAFQEFSLTFHSVRFGALRYGKLGVLSSLPITCMGRNSQLSRKFPNFIDGQPGKNRKSKDWRKWMEWNMEK